MKTIDKDTIATIAVQKAADKGICGIARSMALPLVETQHPLKCLDKLQTSWTAQMSPQYSVEFNFGECPLAPDGGIRPAQERLSTTPGHPRAPPCAST